MLCYQAVILHVNVVVLRLKDRVMHHSSHQAAMNDDQSLEGSVQNPALALTQLYSKELLSTRLLSEAN